MRPKIVAGNWKMNKDFEDALDLVSNIAVILNEKGKPDKTSVILIPPFIYLEMVKDLTEETDIFIGAQNVSEYEEGAYTGEISAAMLSSMGVEYCLAGHSERRKYFGETDQVIARKIDVALKYNVTPVFCCGETLEERENAKQFEVVERQLKESVFHLKTDDIKNIIIAYEPVWAIGTGVNATPAQAQEMHGFIRSLIAGRYSDEVANVIPLLYGGSCNAKNAADLFSMPDVDGGLVGGASLDAQVFTDIIGISEASG